ncbi:hypothetical protein [Methylobacterium nodulans]|uniref:Uncharacterized protein n=1 Tax=Methylobacterium nodulans (strain LMG 21967 / CNCM I-2342 / ORS 2060) TaxID=460265 RepID=B8IUU1_METNO|nr:hypothetical protein [Methylobacterium nodulans]ACL58999.1 hypothetical protein Mnod_4120 [Methylobacterium nodulans ORS 2060]
MADSPFSTADGFWCDECQNLGTTECLCGGDLCVCDAYGELPCPKCSGQLWSMADDREEGP